jgi:hypothetical protein
VARRASPKRILARERHKPSPIDFAHYPVEVSMTRTFVPLRRIAALSVAITLFAAPIASAQSFEAAQPSAAPNNTVLLSPGAFARLVQPSRAEVAPAPVVADAPRPSLLRQGTTAMAREARATAAKAPQGSWGSRHPTAKVWLIAGIAGVSAFLGVLAFCTMAVYCWGE